jgi:hypothetical protein
MFISIDDAVNLYPSLLIDLEREQVKDWCFRFVGRTEHQKQAAKKAQQLCRWHERHILEMCPQARPPLRFDSSVEKEMSLEDWHQKCQLWDKEHEMSIDELAQSWAKFMRSGQVDRVLEPLTYSQSELIISAHDYDELYSA